MSETETNTNTILENTDATTDSPANDAVTQDNWRDSLSEENKSKFKEIGSLDDLVKSHSNLVTKIGKNPIVKPKDDATDEQKAEYSAMLKKELGAPENVDAYEFKLSDDLPEGFINQDLLGGMKDIFFKHGIPPEAAQEVVETYFSKQLESFNEQNKSSEQEVFDAVDTLKKDWGSEFEANVNKAKAFAERNYSKETIEKFGNDPLFIKDTLNLHTATSGDRIDNISGEVKQTPGDLKEEARQIMKSEGYAKSETLQSRVSELYKRAQEMS